MHTVLSLICFVRMDFSELYRNEGKVWDVMKSPLRAKHINDSMFIDDLARWRQYSITLENSNKDTLNVYCAGTTVCIMFVSSSDVVHTTDQTWH